MSADWLRGRVLFIADSDSLGDRLVPLVGACLGGGVKMVQLRAKHLPDQEFYARAVALRELVAAADSVLFINDRVDMALAVEADGVHLGEDDLPVRVARRLLPGRIIGATCRNLEQAETVQSRGADYVSLGAIFPSPTKPSSPVVGLETLKEVAKAVSIPVCAIGGIGLENLGEVLSSGADFVAVSAAISKAPDPEKAAASLVKIAAAGTR